MRLTSNPETATKWAAAATSIKMESDTPLKKDKKTSFYKRIVQ